jgi:RecA-family ATPase
MDILTNTKGRRVLYSKDEDGRVLIVESELEHHGFSARRRWSEWRITLTPDEIKRLAAELEKPK